MSRHSGRVMGVHQKIDRVARRHLTLLLDTSMTFPSRKQILRFEGVNGPDGIKRKSPSIDEPWHFLNPERVEHAPLLEFIEHHLHNLTAALREGNDERSAFEAAWLAHAITDGLTPAHHFPLEETLQTLRGGEGLETRTSIRKKNIMPGNTMVERLRNNWYFWGAKGVMTAHAGFEMGIASAVVSERFEKARPSAAVLKRVESIGYRQYFIETVRHVASLKLYEEYARRGWTLRIGSVVKKQLMPTIIMAVTVAWYEAARQAAQEPTS